MTPRKKRAVRLGDVFEIPLPDGRFAYGRVYRDAAVGIYRLISQEPNKPPVGSRDFQFFVGMYERILGKGEWEIVAHDPFATDDESWPPPGCIKDPLDGSYEVYVRGVIKRSTEEACKGLEPVAVWDSNHIVDRILHGSKSKFLRSLYQR